MDSFLIFGVLPTLVALCVLGLSLVSAVRAPGLLQGALALPTLTVTMWALFVLLRMMAGAWPTSLPYLALAGTIPLAMIQWLLARRAARAPAAD